MAAFAPGAIFLACRACVLRMTVLERLRAQRRGLLHVIDPFKIAAQEAADKAVTLEQCGFSALLVGSTNCDEFEQTVPGYLETLRRVTKLPLILHFPPAKGVGFRLCRRAHGAFIHAVPCASDEYFRYQASQETLRQHDMSGSDKIELLRSAAFVFGDDLKTAAAVSVCATRDSDDALIEHAAAVRCGPFDLAYLYSRHAGVPILACQTFREHLRFDQMLFVGGGVRSAAKARAYLDAGADYVVFGSALERSDWRAALRQLAPHIRDRARLTP